MQNRLRVVRTPSGRNSETVKPEAPPDLWAQLDELYCGHQRPIPTGEGWFTAGEYAVRSGISSRAALDRLNNLHKAGKLEKHQIIPGQQAYYRIPNGRAGQ